MSNGTIRGVAYDITEHVHYPELFEKFGAGTRVYETYIYLDSHRVYIADTSPSFELWHVGCRIVPENYLSLDDEDSYELLGDMEIELDSASEEVTYTYCRSVLGFTSELHTPDEIEEDQKYEEWYMEVIEDIREWCRGNDGPGHIVTEYESWARTQNK